MGKLNTTYLKIGDTVRHEGVEWRLDGRIPPSGKSRCDGCERDCSIEVGYQFSAAPENPADSVRPCALWCAECVEAVIAYEMRT